MRYRTIILGLTLTLLTMYTSYEKQYSLNNSKSKLITEDVKKILVNTIK